jgi:hypothetical protein
MTTSPSFNGGWDNDMSSKGTMEAVLAPEDTSTSPSHDPHGQSTTNHTIHPSSDKECQLGATFLMPIGECIAHMAPNTATEDALLELLYMTLSRAGVQLYLFDESVAFIEWRVSTTFQKGDTLPRWATLIKQIADKHSVPPPDSVPVSLEINANGVDEYCQCQEDVVTVQVWLFKQIMQEYLLDHFLFGNQSNLVNICNPWVKYISSDLDDKEMLASYWYSKTWDKNITNPNTHPIPPMPQGLC